MHSIALAVMISWSSFGPSPSDVLQTGNVLDWALPRLAGWSSVLTRDGAPVTVFGHQPLPGWGSFDSVRVMTPLEAGVWGAGRWELAFSSFDIPDSSFSSAIGLIENTEGRNRYSASLRRPLMSSIGLDLSMARDDTLNDQRIALRMGRLEAGGRGWQTQQDGYSLWSGWRPDNARARIAYAHFRSGSDYWEAMAMWEPDLGSLGLQGAAAVSIEDDSLLALETHVRFEAPIWGMTAVTRGDLESVDGDIRGGGTAGLFYSPWILRLQAGMAARPGEDPEILGAAAAGPMSVFIGTGDDGPAYGIQADMNTDHGFLQAGASVRDDTLRFAGTLMPSLRWGAGGRLHGGMSWEVTDADTATFGTIDLKSMFTLGRFAFIFAVEDVLDDWRSYSFGVTWTFSDRRELPELEDR